MLDDQTSKLSDVISTLSKEMLRLGTGPLAELRRMNVEGPGTAAFWQLALKSGLRTDTTGLQLVKLMAMLTPKGASGGKKLHIFERPFGGALSKAGMNDVRLMRFLALRHDDRFEALERLVRFLVAKSDNTGVNCLDIACLLVSPDVKHSRKLAKDFYSAAHAESSQQKDTE